MDSIRNTYPLLMAAPMLALYLLLRVRAAHDFIVLFFLILALVLIGLFLVLLG